MSGNQGTPEYTKLDADNTPPQPAMSEADAKRKNMLEKKIASLQINVDKMLAEKREMEGKLKNADAGATVKEHIKLLHEYNEIKDVGMGLLGMIAEQRGTRIKDVMDEFGLDEKD